MTGQWEVKVAEEVTVRGINGDGQANLAGWANARRAD